MRDQPLRLGEKLLQKGKINADQLRIALMEQKISGRKLGEVLVTLGFLTERSIREILGEVVGYASISLKDIVPDASALTLIPESFARNHSIMPVSLVEHQLRVAMKDPHDLFLIDKLNRHLGEDIFVLPLLAAESDIQYAIDYFYGYELSIEGILKELESGEESDYEFSQQDEYSQPVVRLVDAILTDAVKQSASDVHFEPEEYFIRVRYRIDGVLKDVRLFHKSFWSGMAIRLKVMGDLDLTDQRLPQDGRMSLVVHGRKIDFRVSSFPGVEGESIVLRVLDKEKGVISFETLGLEQKDRVLLKQMMSKPNGLLLVTGPTGSGKTTTLYALLNELDSTAMNIMTLEDPVEYPLPGIRQTSINEEIGMTFSLGVKALLRQDPDVILIGEIRDEETADMALRAAMTGHQVLATLHTNSAIGAISRLLDMGVAGSILSGNVIGVLAQRLVRELCSQCKRSYFPNASERAIMGWQDTDERNLFCAEGCDACQGSGYKGRLMVLELLPFSEEINALLLSGASQQDISESFVADGRTCLIDDVLDKVAQGKTSLAEAARVVALPKGTLQ